MEQVGRESAAVSRGQNVVYVMPHDWASIAQFLGPMLERVDATSRDVQLLLVSSDIELAAALAASTVKLTDGRDIDVIAATSLRRATRLMRVLPAQVIAATPETLLDLIRGAVLKLDAVKMIAIAWLDELVVGGSTAALESVMAEVPKDAARTVVTAELSPTVEELLERYARRARRVLSATGDVGLPMQVEYVTTAADSRLATLRRTLDELDPASAVVFVRDRESDARVRDLLRSLGYSREGSTVRVGLTAPPGTDLVVLFDVPASREELREAAGAASRVVALIQPRQVSSLRALAVDGVLKPLVLRESADRARERDARMLAELRARLQEGHFGRELIALEPLLEAYDGIEIAAAALQLLEQERVRSATAAAASTAAAGAPSSARERGSGPMTRLFVNVGARDNARPGDLVGAITNQGGITSADVGKVDVRESHSIVEVSPSVADGVIERVTGTTIRGRRAVLRRDEERPRREARPDDRGGGRGDRSPRAAGSARSGQSRGTDRGARPNRPTRPAPRRDDE